MLKKLISYAICICVILGMVICPADAAAPIVYDKGETVIFDQDFGGLSSNTDSKLDSKLEITGDWHFQKSYIMEKGYGAVLTKSATDLSSAESVKFTAEAILTWNGIGMNLGTSSTGNTYNGYKVYLASDGMYLFKNGIKLKEDGKVDKANADASTTLSGGYGGFAKYIVNVSGNTITITIDGKSGSLVYTDNTVEKIELNGLFGIEDMSTGGLAIFNMSLKAYDTVTVNDWRYEHVFSAIDTVEQLAKDGLVFNEAEFTGWNANDKCVDTTASTTYTFAPDGASISGDYTVEIESMYGWGGQAYRFNYIDESNYYELSSYQYNVDGIKSSNITLKKKKGGQETVLYNENIRDTSADNYISPGYTWAKYNISVAEQDDKKIITASVSANNKKSTIPVITDEDPILQGGIIKSVQGNGDAGRHRAFRAYSTPSGAVSERNVTLIDKTITENDTLESLANDYGIIAEKGIAYNSFYKIYNTNGNVDYDKTLSGSYTLSGKVLVSWNDYNYYINYKDSSNYYKINFPNAKGITVTKMVGGVSTPLSAIEAEGNATVAAYSHGGKNETVDIKIVPAENSLSMIITKNNGEGAVMSYTVDDTESPITSGKFRVEYGSNGPEEYLSMLKIVSHNDPASSGISEGVFKINGVQTYSYAKGEIYFECPVAIIGGYTVVAALYEDNAMTDVRILRPVDVYGESAMLFDTTNSSAANGSVKVYFIDNTNSLNMLTDVWELK